MFGFIRLKTHLAEVRAVHEEYAADALAAGEAYAETTGALRTENANLRLEIVDLRNKLAEARGKLIAEAHTLGRPAP